MIGKTLNSIPFVDDSVDPQTALVRAALFEGAIMMVGVLMFVASGSWIWLAIAAAVGIVVLFPAVRRMGEQADQPKEGEIRPALSDAMDQDFPEDEAFNS
ncbi:MAG: hypothetical protein AAFR11_14815 [Pseudomonadota bacterium]